jgi:UDP-N-acetylmuramoyl-tripeptide--D-alanyl-D-alanine ligase
VEISALYQLYLQHPSIQTDTRKLQPGDIYWALKGPNFNGNLFAEKALEMGAAYAIVDEPVATQLETHDGTQDAAHETPYQRIILVDDCLSALQALAKYHREQFQIPFIAITGSNGKTTTKELVATVLASHFITATTEGNLNNHIGVPLTLLKIKQGTEIAVIEMGANHQQEIAGYCEYTEPTHGIITNCGKAHLEGFGGVEGIRKGKGELYDYLRAHGGTALRYADYDYLLEMSLGIEKTFDYGQTSGDVQGQIINQEIDQEQIINKETVHDSNTHSSPKTHPPTNNNPFLKVLITKGFATPTTIHTQLVGDYNLPNVLCAVAIGIYCKVPAEKIVAAIENYAPSNSRSQLMQLGSNQIILDAYNANPSSMKLAIENFARLSVSGKVLMLGGMMELGVESMAEHEAIAALIGQYEWEKVVLVGGDFSKIKHPYLYFSDSLAAKEWFLSQDFKNAYLLVKGSRSMQMEKIIQP